MITAIFPTWVVSMDSTTYNDEAVVRSEFPLLVVVVYLPRIQILVVGGYRGSPPNAHLHPTHTLSKIQPPHSNMDHISHNDRIELAITDLESQAQPNFAATAQKYNVKRITLARRFKGESVSR
jgi:hypothetical protein